MSFGGLAAVRSRFEKARSTGVEDFATPKDTPALSGLQHALARALPLVLRLVGRRARPR